MSSKTFKTEIGAARYFQTKRNDIETEQCPLCKKWSVSYADHDEGAIVPIGDEYQDEFNGECRGCEDCVDG